MRRRVYDEIEFESDGKEWEHSRPDGSTYYRSTCKPHIAGQLKVNRQAAAELDAALGNFLFAGPGCRRLSSTEADRNPPPDDAVKIEILREITGRLKRLIAEGTETTVIRLVVPRSTSTAEARSSQT
jgi:hypothetical protein